MGRGESVQKIERRGGVSLIPVKNVIDDGRVEDGTKPSEGCSQENEGGDGFQPFGLANAQFVCLPEGD